MGEDAKVALRNERRNANEEVKKAKKDSTMTEDEATASEKLIQDVTDKFVKNVDAITDAKNKERTKKILESVKLISYAESLGGVESLITYPMLQTHGDVPVEIREHLGITEDFLRMSVGIENVEDIIADLKQALED